MRLEEFTKALQVTVPSTLVSGTIKAVLPNGRGQVTLSTGPELGNVSLPVGSQVNDEVLLFRAPRGNVWNAVLINRRAEPAVPDSDEETTFVAMPEHVRWFTVYDKVILSWYVWPKFTGAFEVQVAFNSDKSDALTWAITSGGVSVFNPGSASHFYARIRAINQFYVTSEWTDWYEIVVGSPNTNGIGGGMPDEIAIWNLAGLRGDSRLLWQNGERLYVGDVPTYTQVGNMAHQGAVLDTYPIIEQTFTPGQAGNITSLSINLASLEEYKVRVILKIADASVFTSDVSHIPGVTTVSTGNIAVSAYDDCSLVVQEIDPDAYPHLFYTRWNTYTGGQVITPALTDDVDMAFMVNLNLANTPNFTTIDTGIGFSDVWRIDPTASDVELSRLGETILKLGTHNHTGAAGMGALVDAANVIYTPANVSDWQGDVDPGGVADALDQLAGNVSAPTRQTIFTFAGDLEVSDGPLRIYNQLDTTQTISKVFICASTVPVGAEIVVDVHKDGVTLFTNQAHRPSIASSEYSGVTEDIDIDTWAVGEYLTFHVDQIGSSIPGANLVVHIIHS